MTQIAPRFVDLSHELVGGVSASHAHGAPSITIRPHRAGSISEISITSIAMSTHAGTHVDAARHFIPEGRTIDRYPLEAFHGPGVVLDVRREGVVSLSGDDIRSRRPKIRPGDIVLFCFGYAERYGHSDYARHPYLTADAADLMVELGVRMIGVDTLTPDLPHEARDSAFAFPVHHKLLGQDILIIENLGPGLAQLMGRRVEIYAVPVAVRGADGAPARVFARAC